MGQNELVPSDPLYRGLSVSYHRDQVKLDVDFYAAHATVFLFSTSPFAFYRRTWDVARLDLSISSVGSATRTNGKRFSPCGTWTGATTNGASSRSNRRRKSRPSDCASSKPKAAVGEESSSCKSETSECSPTNDGGGEQSETENSP